MLSYASDYKITSCLLTITTTPFSASGSASTITLPCTSDSTNTTFTSTYTVRSGQQAQMRAWRNATTDNTVASVETKGLLTVSAFNSSGGLLISSGGYSSSPFIMMENQYRQSNVVILPSTVKFRIQVRPPKLVLKPGVAALRQIIIKEQGRANLSSYPGGATIVGVDVSVRIEAELNDSISLGLSPEVLNIDCMPGSCSGHSKLLITNNVPAASVSCDASSSAANIAPEFIRRDSMFSYGDQFTNVNVSTPISVKVTDKQPKPGTNTYRVTVNCHLN